MTDTGSGDLPLDPDTQTLSVGRPLHRRLWPIVLVFAGGVLGTAVREGLVAVFPALGGVPVTVFAINVVGAFLLGVLLEALVRAGSDTGARRGWRLFVGTGVIGGFTTYSALAVDTARLLGGAAGWAGCGGSAVLGVAYAAGTVAVGAAATVLGIVVGSRRAHARSRTGKGPL